MLIVFYILSVAGVLLGGILGTMIRRCTAHHLDFKTGPLPRSLHFPTGAHPPLSHAPGRAAGRLSTAKRRFVGEEASWTPRFSI